MEKYFTSLILMVVDVLDFLLWRHMFGFETAIIFALAYTNGRNWDN